MFLKNVGHAASFVAQNEEDGVRVPVLTIENMFWCY